MKKIYELIPPLKEYIWAGENLKKYKKTELGKISESRELSFLKGDETKLIYDNQEITISEFIEKEEIKKYINPKLKNLLVKLIDSSQSLSIQVHPSDEYALKYENSLGKTEMWIILEAEENSYINLGFSKDVSKSDFPELIKDDSILKCLNKIYVKPGDVYLIKPGTIHAIGKGITLLEIQESSKLTYRVYDFNRVDNSGNKRELHVNKAMDVLNFSRLEVKNLKEEKEIKTEYFVVKGDVVNEEKEVEISKASIITVIDGEGKIDELNVSKYKSYLILPSKKLFLKGRFKYFLTSV